MNGSELLREAGALVALGWCQDAAARSLQGMAVEVGASDAAAWSLVGALQAVTFSDASTSVDDLRHALAAIADLIEDPSLIDWNDAPGRTQAEVQALLERASQRLAA